MRRFFYCQSVLHKKGLDGFGINAELLFSQSQRERLAAQGRVLDFFYQDRNRLKRCWLPSLRTQHAAALLLLGINGLIGTIVNESPLSLLSFDLSMIGK